MPRVIYIDREAPITLAVKPRPVLRPRLAELPAVLMHGENVKVPTQAGYEEWRELRAAGHTPEEADRAVYANANYGKLWNARGDRA